LRKTKYKHGRQLNVILHVLFYENNSGTVALRQMKFCTVKDHGHSYKFHLFNYEAQISFNATFLIKYVLNIRHTNMAAKEFSRLYTNAFIFRIYNMG
jgi:hypothetical protein